MKRLPKPNKIVIATLFAAMLNAGCEKEIDPGTLPDQDPKLVVNSFITNATFPAVTISISRSVLDNKPFKLVDNAACDLYENGLFKARFTHLFDGYYAGDLITTPGNEYALRVTVPGFPEAEGATRIPPVAEITGVSVNDTMYSTLYYNNNTGVGYNYAGNVDVLVRLRDDPNEENYYGLTPFFIIKDENNFVIDSVVAFPQVPESGELFEEVEYIDNGMLSVTDEIVVNGNEIHVPISVVIHDSYRYSTLIPKTFELGFLVVSLSPEAYKYRIATMKQQNSPGFFSEPVIIPNNIKNGLGVFGGASLTSKRVLKGSVRKL